MTGAAKVAEQEGAIPLAHLGPEHPIKSGGEVVFYEDELGDVGSARFAVRFRIMDDCWFLLLRSYTRVDNHLVRMYDTRYFAFLNGPSEVRRDFAWREASYVELLKREFHFSAAWCLS